MPISLSRIAANTAHVTFAWDQDNITIIYRPGRVTEKIFAELEAFNHLNADSLMESFASLNDILVRLIVSWDVYEDDAQEQMFPLAPDRLRELPVLFRMEVLKAIMSDMRPEDVAPQTKTKK
jgi:hypothetical protein